MAILIPVNQYLTNPNQYFNLNQIFNQYLIDTCESLPIFTNT